MCCLVWEWQVCHGTPSEMVVVGGEVDFVERMVVESLAEKRVVWWTCMLGKLSSVARVAARLKTLSADAQIGGWGLTELRTGGGRTKRWVVMWTNTPLRLSDVSIPAQTHATSNTR